MNYLIEGRIIPERVDISMPSLSLTLNSPGPASCTLQIIRSKIFMNLHAAEQLDLPTVRNALFGLVGDVVNQIGFRCVIAVSYELESISCIEERWTEVFSSEGFVFADRSGFGEKLTFMPQPFGALDLNVDQLNSVAITRAFFELRNSLRYPDFTALHCRLAIEAVRTHFSDRDDAAWSKMRDALQVSRDTLERCKDAADKQRHGRNVPQSWEERRAAMQIAWEVCHRFLIWLGTESEQPLDVAKFPSF